MQSVKNDSTNSINLIFIYTLQLIFRKFAYPCGCDFTKVIQVLKLIKCNMKYIITLIVLICSLSLSAQNIRNYTVKYSSIQVEGEWSNWEKYHAVITWKNSEIKVHEHDSYTFHLIREIENHSDEVIKYKAVDNDGETCNILVDLRNGHVVLNILWSGGIGVAYQLTE
ncbi:MAG: hypothetical protein CMC96_09315 [Flavobacteriales bacterium]|nr:hypothetical protein [Flavobacteriales bacterium]